MKLKSVTSAAAAAAIALVLAGCVKEGAWRAVYDYPGEPAGAVKISIPKPAAPTSVAIAQPEGKKMTPFERRRAIDDRSRYYSGVAIAPPPPAGLIERTTPTAAPAIRTPAGKPRQARTSPPGSQKRKDTTQMWKQHGIEKGRPGYYAKIDTSKGMIECYIFEEESPIGAKNFIDLVMGKKEFLDPKTHKMVTRRFYDGLTFHRVIPGFMIQGGDPEGTGRGGPGYKFQNENHPSLKFDRPGRLAYANSGPDTNGSQFFITVAKTPWLDGKYTIFGQVVSGGEFVEAISVVKRDADDRPLEPISIKTIRFNYVKPKK